MSPAPLRPFERGDIIASKYVLEEALGSGAMGVVWRARNVALDSHVAIKILHPTTNTAVLRERLLLEGKAAAQVGHPAIVKVFDIGETSTGDPFVVMELLRGEPLGALLARVRRLPPTEAVRLLLPIVDALQCAHEKGLIHRDVKPDNIFLSEEAGGVRPKLVDFGIVKLDRSATALNLTQAGTVVGSPDYMSPEQARGQDDLNHLTDIWSLGVVLCELIAGRTPFYATNYNALVHRIVEEEPRTLFELGVADEILSGIVTRCLRKQPAQRFPSMAALGRALAEWLLNQGVVRDIAGTGLENRWLTRPPRAKARASTPSAVPPSTTALETKVLALVRATSNRRAAALVTALTTASVLAASLGSIGFTNREPGRIPTDLRGPTPRAAAATLKPEIATEPEPVQFLALASPQPSTALPERAVPLPSDSEPTNARIRTAQRQRSKASDLLDPY